MSKTGGVCQIETPQTGRFPPRAEGARLRALALGAFIGPLEAGIAWRRTMATKLADLGGPVTGDYSELEQVLPAGYTSLLGRKETQKAIFALKRFIDLCRELGLMMVTSPLLVDAESGINDIDAAHTPIQFHISNDRDEHPVDAQIMQAATKWKRLALREFNLPASKGICTDMRSVRKDYFLDHDHSACVDSWDWEKVITPEEHSLEFLKRTVNHVWSVLVEAELFALDLFPKLKGARVRPLPRKLTFLHAEDIQQMFPGLPRRERETEILKEYPAIFLIGIGWPLGDGSPHEERPPDCDDWTAETVSTTGKHMHGLNGDILVWNQITERRLELSSMGIRVDGPALRHQLKMSGMLGQLKFPYDQAVVFDELPPSIGGAIGQARTLMLLLRKAHLGEVTVSVWPKVLKDMCAKRNIFLLE
jgi:aspartate--ammonia ligase